MGGSVPDLGEENPVRNFLNEPTRVGDNMGANRERGDVTLRTDPFSLPLELSCVSLPVDFVELERRICRGRSFVCTWTRRLSVPG
jgi:hypothetical protein